MKPSALLVRSLAGAVLAGAVLLAVAFYAGALAPALAQAKPVVWKVGASWPATDPAFTMNLKPLAERVERLSGGRLK
jgi:TRAP-type C4-dicarboxylate transport system substrate-binding protein